jgi:hypothetical protein
MQQVRIQESLLFLPLTWRSHTSDLGCMRCNRGCNPYPNVVKKWLEFTRAIERDRVKGRYTERVSKRCNHQPQSMVSSQEINSTLLRVLRKNCQKMGFQQEEAGTHR